MSALTEQEEVVLTPTEQQLLAIFQSHPGEFLSPEAINVILHSQQPYSSDSSAVRVLTSRLRSKIGPELIRTVKGKGYSYLGAENTVKVDPSRILLDGQPIRLSRIETPILITLIKKCGDLVTRQELLSAASPNWDLLELTPPALGGLLSMRISRIRRKLEVSQSRPTIFGIYGRGYLLDDPLHGLKLEENPYLKQPAP